jgi:SET domain-containing protein
MSALDDGAYVRAGLYLGPTAVHGTGVFTRDAILQGSPVINFVGPVLRASELAPDARYLQVDDALYIADSGGLDDFVNHSCEPNLSFVGGGLMLYARRAIAPGEQLFWDYSTSINEPGWRLPCRCGGLTCRGQIVSFCDLSEDDKARLRPMALRYLQR